MGRVAEWKSARRALSGKPRRTGSGRCGTDHGAAIDAHAERPRAAACAGSRRRRADARLRLPCRFTTGRRNSGSVRQPLRPSLRFTGREYSCAELRHRSITNRVVRHRGGRVGSRCWLRAPIAPAQPRADRPAATDPGQTRRQEASQYRSRVAPADHSITALDDARVWLLVLCAESELVAAATSSPLASPHEAEETVLAESSTR